VDKPTPKVDKPKEEKAEPKGYTFTEEQMMEAKLTQRQKKRLGLLPTKFLSEAAKKRNEMLRERMIKINEERRKAKAAEEKAARRKASPPPSPKKKPREESPPQSPKKKKRPVVEESESESEDPYIQRKAQKISKTLKTLSKVEEQLQSLKSQNQHNPFFNLLLK
jgi:hypothetical protein